MANIWHMFPGFLQISAKHFGISEEPWRCLSVLCALSHWAYAHHSLEMRDTIANWCLPLFHFVSTWNFQSEHLDQFSGMFSLYALRMSQFCLHHTGLSCNFDILMPVSTVLCLFFVLCLFLKAQWVLLTNRTNFFVYVCELPIVAVIGDKVEMHLKK